jgi:hypothetical protein
VNERIIEMAKQCGDWNGQTIEMNDVGISKFAELIVEECISIAVAGNAKAVVTVIKERFGVEE